MIRWFLLALLPVICLPACGNKALATKIQKFTGARTKVVWQRDIDGKGHFGGDQAVYRLMCFDTAEETERELAPGPASYAMPIITPDGSRVVFSDTVNQKVYELDWAGGDKRELLDGYWALDVWVHPGTGETWVYAGRAEAFPKLTEVSRFPIDRPAELEPVWSGTTNHNRLSVAPDGTLAGTFPWPKCGVAEFGSKSWEYVARGCCPDIAPDGTGRFFIFRGDHHKLTMWDDVMRLRVEGEPEDVAEHRTGRRALRINGLPGARGKEVWYPYWTNHGQFITVCGPFPKGIQKHAPSNVYIGRFNEEFTSVDRWVQVSESEQLETMPSAWIEPELHNPAGTPPGEWTFYAQRHATLLRRVWKRELDILFIGDSLTQRWDLGEWSEHYGERKADKFGIDGDTTSRLLWRLQAGELEGISPKVVVLLIGTNDITQALGTPLAIAQRIKMNIDLIRRKLPTTRIIVVGVPPVGYPGFYPRPESERINRITQFYENGDSVRYFDLGRHLLLEDDKIAGRMLTDTVHFTRTAYAIYAEKLEPLLTEVLALPPLVGD